MCWVQQVIVCYLLNKLVTQFTNKLKLLITANECWYMWTFLINETAKFNCWYVLSFLLINETDKFNC